MKNQLEQINKLIVGSAENHVENSVIKLKLNNYYFHGIYQH